MSEKSKFYYNYNKQNYIEFLQDEFESHGVEIKYDFAKKLYKSIRDSIFKIDYPICLNVRAFNRTDEAKIYKDIIYILKKEPIESLTKNCKYMTKAKIKVITQYREEILRRENIVKHKNEQAEQYNQKLINFYKEKEREDFISKANSQKIHSI